MTHSLFSVSRYLRFLVLYNLLSMATINLSSMQVLSFFRLFSSYPQNTPSLSFNSHPKPSSNILPISLKPYNSEKLRARVVVLAAKSLGETEPVVVSPENEVPAGELPSGAGVYAVYDKDNELQFIGLSRNIAASVSAHRKSVPELCGSVKVRGSGCLWFVTLKCVIYISQLLIVGSHWFIWF